MNLSDECLESIEKELTSLFNNVTRQKLTIEECRNLFNKLINLKTKRDFLCNELNTEWNKKKKRYMISFVIHIVVMALGWFMCFVSPILLLVPLANGLFMFNTYEKIMQETRVVLNKNEKLQRMSPLIHNCCNFLSRKINLACNVSEIEQNKEQKDEENIQNAKLMVVNNLIYSCVYGDKPFKGIDEDKVELAIKILQNDFNTNETDLDKLVSLAKEKVQNDYLNFVRTLCKKQ